MTSFASRGTVSQASLLKQIAADFGISESCLTGWMKKADVEDGAKPGLTSEQSAENS